MSASGTYTDHLLESLLPSQDGPVTLRLHTDPPSPRSVLDASDGDLITVVQPDGTRETYRLTKATPSGDGFSVTFQVQRVLTSADPEPPPGTIVRDSCAGEWQRGYDEDNEPGWVRTDIDGSDPESWFKIAGNYGPVTVLEPGGP